MAAPTRLIITAYKVTGTHTVAYPYNMDGNSGRRVYKKSREEIENRERAKYSEQARKRFRNALDNFICLHRAAEIHNPNLLFYDFHGKTHRRKPVFITLTVPEQAVGDMVLKRSALANVLENLRRSYGMLSYLWKAEAQERGAIHFHLLVDAFIPEARLRYMWFKNLKRLGCIPAKQTLKKSSRLVHFKVIHNLATAMEEVGGYFDGERDETGVLLHKHDSSKRVRDIEGRSWGCSDNIKYRQLTLWDVEQPLVAEINSQAHKIIEVEGNSGTKVAEVYIRKKIFWSHKHNKYLCFEKPGSIDKLLNSYHLAKAEGIYCRKKKTKHRRIFDTANSGAHLLFADSYFCPLPDFK